MLRRAAAIGSEPDATEIALDALANGGTATDAVLAGFFGAAAARPGALFAPVSVLVSGPGVGSRSFDGRPLQPGQAAKRPRGLVPEDAVPPAAAAAVPASLAALALAHAHDGSLSLSRLVRPAVEKARAAQQSGRERVLSRVAALGAGALRDPTVTRFIVAAAGRAQGGLVTEQDLAEIRPATGAPRVLGAGPRKLLVSPWGEPGAPGRGVEIVAAGDRRGVLAVLAYAPDDGGVDVPELGLTLPRDATVVRRGVPRVRPGAPLGPVAPVAVLAEGEISVVALGVCTDQAPSDDAWLESIASLAPAGMILAALRTKLRGAAALGVVRSVDQDEMSALTV